MTRGIPRYRQDWRSLAFVALALLFLVAPHAWHPPVWMAPLWIGSAAFLCFASSIINHNHMHCEIFSTPWLNGLLNLILSIARGHTASGVIVPHNLNHHVETSEVGDWIRPELSGAGLGWVRLVRYVIKASGNMMVQRLRKGAPRPPKPRLGSLAAEKITLAGMVIIAGWHDWEVFLLFNVLPWFLGLAFLVGVNLLQHDGCDPRRPFGESRNFTGCLGNWLLFNNGFHTAHHFNPRLHWSELPALHFSIRAGFPRQDLEVRSIVAYLWRFGWSRRVSISRRTRFG